MTIAAGQNRVCTITNNDIPLGAATIQVNKVVINDDGGTRVIADFPLFVNTTAVVNGVINTFSPGTYTISETNQSGYTSSISGDCGASGQVIVAAGQNRVCTITNNDTASGGGGGGGGSRRSPNIILSAVPQGEVLGAIYLSQIPYTGLELGPLGTVLYWLALAAWALALAYLVLFGAVPLMSRSARSFGSRVQEALNVREPHVAPVMVSEPAPAPVIQAPRGYSSYDGFKSFAHNGALSIEDIVKGLARSHPAPVFEHTKSVRNIEPIYENVEPIATNTAQLPVESLNAEPVSAPAHTRGFIAALVEGDRAAVFAGLRQHVRGGGASEQLISPIVCLLDDAYRARIDGTDCDADIARMTARLDTPTLEKLVASLTTAIDSSYSTGVTGAKLALTRALAVLGA